jgi:hypothetical protein
VNVLLSVENMRKLVLGTADLREASWDKVNRRYRLNTIEAAELACSILDFDRGFCVVAGMALTDGAWNDTLCWADDGAQRQPLRIPPGHVFPAREPVG